MFRGGRTDKKRYEDRAKPVSRKTFWRSKWGGGEELSRKSRRPRNMLDQDTVESRGWKREDATIKVQTEEPGPNSIACYVGDM